MRRRDLFTAGGAALAGAGSAHAQAPIQAAPATPDQPYVAGRGLVAGLNRIVTPNGVQETFEATLGGVRQVVNVRGADRRNPLLLFVHGGPASVEMPLAWAFQRPWEDVFTVVQWDQRAAGRTFRLDPAAAPAATLRPERYRDDALELIELLLNRYGQRKVVLLGHSWGSVVGLMTAIARPERLHAYIGVGQVIDGRENERRGYAWTLAEARRRGNAQATAELEGLAPYPGEPWDIDKVAVERRWNVRFGGLAAGRHTDDGEWYFHLGRLSPEYGLEDRRAWDAGSAFTMPAVFPQLQNTDFTAVTRLAVPTFMLLGRQDTTTPSAIAAEWLDRLTAPAKAAVWFEHSAHLPFIEEPGHFFRALLTHALPLSERALGAT